MNNQWRLIFATAFLLLSIVGLNSGFAQPEEPKQNLNNQGNVKAELEAEFQTDVAPAAPDSPTIEGAAVYEKKRNKNLNRQRLKAKIEIPVPTLSITDMASAQSAIVEIRFSRGAARYATCSLKLDEFDPDKAEYKLDVRFQEQPGDYPVTRERAGSCDLVNDSMLAPSQGVPAVLAGDSAIVVLVVETVSATAPESSVKTETQLLSGSFGSD
jgi:hypothetical protein